MLDKKCSLKTALYKSRFIIISVALSAVSYKIALDILKKSGKVIEFYNNQMTPLSDLPERIILAVKLGFGNLVNYNVAFMPLSMTILFALFLVAFLVFLWLANLNKSTKLSILILLCGAILASQMHIILSKTITSDPRVQYYGLMFLRVLIVALVFKICIDFIRAQKLAQNLLFILSTILIWFCIVQDLYAQKLQKLSNDAELKLLNRVIDRIEQNENFNPNKQYCGIMFGKPKAMKDFIGFTLFPHWDMQSVFANTMSKNVFEGCKVYSDTSQMRKDSNPKEVKVFYNIISRLHKAGILDKLEPFPHKDSVVVFEDIIVFVASKGNLDEIRKMVKTPTLR